ncbi:hypothetical protein [Microbulbifer litoralis]|uniref:hypothetical protein n=1 Tax=Microbulbifer litoralis TaxID=2933965 RepID=UPI002027CCDB|nr:hypothetical protein [Microbulbifer sp. GX H0434]
MSFQALAFCFAAIVLAPVSLAFADERDRLEPEQRALSVAASHLQVDPSELRVVKIEAVRWEDSSLGCPKPGRRYLPSVTAGYRALVYHGEREYQVHLGQKRGLVCEGILRKGP